MQKVMAAFVIGLITLVAAGCSPTQRSSDAVTWAEAQPGVTEVSYEPIREGSADQNGIRLIVSVTSLETARDFLAEFRSYSNQLFGFRVWEVWITWNVGGGRVGLATRTGNGADEDDRHWQLAAEPLPPGATARWVEFNMSRGGADKGTVLAYKADDVARFAAQATPAMGGEGVDTYLVGKGPDCILRPKREDGIRIGCDGGEVAEARSPEQLRQMGASLIALRRAGMHGPIDGNVVHLNNPGSVASGTEVIATNNGANLVLTSVSGSGRLTTNPSPDVAAATDEVLPYVKGTNTTIVGRRVDVETDDTVACRGWLSPPAIDLTINLVCEGSLPLNASGVSSDQLGEAGPGIELTVDAGVRHLYLDADTIMINIDEKTDLNAAMSAVRSIWSSGTRVIELYRGGAGVSFTSTPDGTAQSPTVSRDDLPEPGSVEADWVAAWDATA